MAQKKKLLITFMNFTICQVSVPVSGDSGIVKYSLGLYVLRPHGVGKEMKLSLPPDLSVAFRQTCGLP